MIIEKTCISCHETSRLEVDENAYRNWKNNGMLIQKALPSLTDGERELLISGICGECFDSMFIEDTENMYWKETK